MAMSKHERLARSMKSYVATYEKLKELRHDLELESMDMDAFIQFIKDTIDEKQKEN